MRSLRDWRRKCKPISRSRIFAIFPPIELRERVYEIYRHLGEWLLGKNELDIEHRYREIGARRAQQKVPLSEVVQAIVLVKENLWDFLKSEAVMDRAIEIMGELELLQMLEMFFDRAIYYAAVGYEEELARDRARSWRAAGQLGERTTMSLSWEMEYKKRLKTADDALQCVQSGMRVYIQPGCAEPETLVEALMRRGPEVYDVEIVHMMTMGCAPYVAPEMAGHFRHNAVFIGANVRDAINDGRADYTPIYLSEIEGLV